ncbi:MAG: serine/threonine protein kinase, partial [Bradymonadaceae bacterium]
PRVKLADFGVAHALRREDPLEGDELESTAGTPFYMAPEQARAAWREYGPWTDLYAVGCIAWELVCGRPPFQGESSFSLLVQHESEPRPSIDPQFPVPEGLEDWIRRAMAVAPERRFRHAADAAWALPRGDLEAQGRLAGESRADTADSPEAMTTTIQTDEPFEGPRADTLADGDVATEEITRPSEGESPPEQPGETALEGAVRPPIPVDWRPEQTDPLPAPLVGAGLGLFGLREPPFVDRDAERDRIWEALHRVVDSEACEFVVVAGEAGTGKSRLAEWMTTRAHEVGAATTVRATHTPGGGVREGLRGAIERTLRTRELERGEVYDWLVEQLARWSDRDEKVEGHARALTEYLRPTDDGAEEVDGPRFRFSSMRQRLATIVEFLERLARRRPLVLWLDDLQWGSESLAVLEHLRERPGDGPAMLVLGTVRSDVVRGRADLEERLDQIARGERTEWLAIEPLSAVHQRELLEGLLPLEAGLAEGLAERTEGHPLFAMQLLGHWIDEGAIEVGPDGFGVSEASTADLPADIHTLWMKRLERLAAGYEGRDRSSILAALELAAALGREFDEEEWNRLLTEAGIRRLPGLVDRLVDRGLAERTAGGWSFAHGLLVESLERRAERAGRL